MRQFVSLIALVVADYDAALGFYVGKLGFSLVEDTDMGKDKRWVVVSPPGATETRLLLARAADDAQRAAIGAQGGGRVFLFLTTDDFDRDHARYLAAGVRFLEAPRREAYGTVAVFEDLHGNRWDLIEPTAAP
ncbi:MAG: Glyoxalase/bleomycin resistance protein/dioxygenase [Caulobacter sp.]|nr:Glyoxalase/bleomycin resistance protein/dioxygenase [Caulobacter sp.]